MNFLLLSIAFAFPICDNGIGNSHHEETSRCQTTLNVKDTTIVTYRILTPEDFTYYKNIEIHFENSALNAIYGYDDDRINSMTHAERNCDPAIQTIHFVRNFEISQIDAEFYQPNIENIIANVTNDTEKQQQLWNYVAERSMGKFRSYLGSKDPAFNELPLEEQRKIIYSVVAGINYAPSIDKAGNYTFDSADYTNEQMAYLQGYIESAFVIKSYYLEASGFFKTEADSKAIKYVNNIVSKTQWWKNPDLKRQRLLGAPELRGPLSMCQIEFPIGPYKDNIYAAEYKEAKLTVSKNLEGNGGSNIFGLYLFLIIVFLGFLNSIFGKLPVGYY